MSGFLKSRSYCDNCPLECNIKSGKLKRSSQKNEKQYISDTNLDSIDILFLTDCVEQEDDLVKFNKFIVNLGIKNYAITNAIGCRTTTYEVSTPTYATYSYCKIFDIEKYNPKVVIALGKSFFYFTKSSVFPSWRDFREFLFNDTYFYPHIKSKWKGRIYPAGFLPEIFDFSSFEHHHFKYQVEQVIKHIANYDKEKFIMPEYKVEIVSDFNKFIEEHKNETKGAFDTETNSLNVFVDNFEIGCIQSSFDGKIGYVLPIDIVNKRKFSNWLNKIEQWWANGKYDGKCLNRKRISGYHFDEDIPLLYHVLNTERDSNSIKVLSWFIGFGGYEDELDAYVSKYSIKNYLDIPKEILFPYSGIDAIVTYLLKVNADINLIPRQPEVYKMYKEIILPVLPVFQAIEEEGLLVDKEYVNKYHNELVSRLKVIEQDIYSLLGKKINIKSNDELGLALEEMGLPDYGRTKKGIYRTGEEILVQWERDGYEIIKRLLDYRKLATLDNTFVGELQEDEEETKGFFSGKSSKKKKEKGISQYIMGDGRVHGNILPAITDSLRSASKSPNLQNYPKQGEEGKAFRKVFIAPEDYLIFEADYAGFQFRLECDYSRDPEMTDAFLNKGGDLHSLTSQAFFCRDVDIDFFMKHKHEEPYHTIRQKGKTVNLAFSFGYTPFSFQTDIKDEWTEIEIDNYIEEHSLKIIVDNKTLKENKALTVSTHLFNVFFKKYSRLKSYMEERQNLAMKQGYVDCTRFIGARRHLPELLYISDKLSKEKASHYSNLKNIAVNAEAQAGEALNVYIAAKKIYDTIKTKNLRSRLIGCVHDSLVGYCHKSEIEEMYHILKSSMERFDYSIPIVCDIQMGDIWGFGEEIKEKNMKEFIMSIQKGK